LLIQVAGLTQTILLFGAVLLALAVLTQFNRHVRRARPLAEVAPA
jgi:hypothetical protein